MSFKFTNGLATVMLLAVSPCAAAEPPASPGPAFVVGEPTSAVRTLLQPWARPDAPGAARSEEHTSELQSLMRISYAVFCLKKKSCAMTITTYMTQASVD